MNISFKWKNILTFVLFLSSGGLASTVQAGFFSSDCFYLPIPCAEGEKLDDSGPPPIQYSVADFNSKVNVVCSQMDTSGGFIVSQSGCEAKQEECRTGQYGYGGCLRQYCNLDQSGQNYICDRDPFSNCQNVADTWSQAVKDYGDCQTNYLTVTPRDDGSGTTGGTTTATTSTTTSNNPPQCDDTNVLQNCALSDPQEAACNTVSCVNGRCHYVGNASGEYTWVSEPGKRDHHPLPTNHPACPYPNKPYAYCTNSGLSGLDYCFPADQPLASNNTGGGGSSSACNPGTTVAYGVFPNLCGWNPTLPPGSGLLCPDGKHATTSCLNYNMDPSLTVGLPAYPPDCCQL